jgi:hypothetical protein
MAWHGMVWYYVLWLCINISFRITTSDMESGGACCESVLELGMDKGLFSVRLTARVYEVIVSLFTLLVKPTRPLNVILLFLLFFVSSFFVDFDYLK